MVKLITIYVLIRVPIINLKNELELLADYEVEVELKKKTKPVE